MKILYHHRIASSDGQYVHVAEMINALQSLGHEVRMVGPKLMETQAFGEESHWIATLKRYMPRSIYELLELGYSARDYLRLSSVARSWKPDVIYERYNLYFVSGAWVHRRLGTTFFVEVNAPLRDERRKYGGLVLDSLARWSERLVWRTADHVFAVTDVLARRVAAEVQSTTRITVTPNGIDASRYRRLPRREDAKAKLACADKIVLGFTGFVRRWHGLDQVIRLINSRRDLPLHLMVVGDGPDRLRLEACASSLGVSDRVTFCGLVAREQVPEYISAFDVALQPAVVPYASPLKLFEYMAAGCAIVAPDSENIQEILTHEANALLFANGDTVALADQVLRLAADPALRARLSTAARETIEALDLTWTHNAQTVVSIAKQVLAQKRGRSGAPNLGESQSERSP